MSVPGIRVFDVTDDWQPLSVRLGVEEPDGPFEGVPNHLAGPLTQWLKEVGENRLSWGEDQSERAFTRIAVRLRIPTESVFSARYQVIEKTKNDPVRRLNLVDAALKRVGDARDAVRLREVLEDGGSVWTVSSDSKALLRTVQPEMQAIYDGASAESDAVSLELRTAWGHAFGLHPDESDAWDHAIKAVEEALCPYVLPNDSSRTLGKVIGNLKTNGNWHSWIRGKHDSKSTEAVVVMLEALWGNSDRHGGVPHGRPVREGEGKAMVCLAATVIQLWRTETLLVKTSSTD